MHTGAANITFEFLGILYGIAHLRVGWVLCFLQQRDLSNGVGEIHLWHLAIHFIQTVGDGFTQSIRFSQRKFFHASHIFNGVLCCHRTICDDVGAVFFSIFVFHPFEHTRSTVIIKVGVDIRQWNTVGIEEALKKQVVLHRVDFGNTEAISHYRTCSRATTGTHHNSEFLLGGIYKVLHNQEVTGESHGFHYVKLESYSVVYLFIERCWI